MKLSKILFISIGVVILLIIGSLLIYSAFLFFPIRIPTFLDQSVRKDTNEVQNIAMQLNLGSENKIDVYREPITTLGGIAKDTIIGRYTTDETLETFKENIKTLPYLKDPLYQLYGDKANYLPKPDCENVFNDLNFSQPPKLIWYGNKTGYKVTNGKVDLSQSDYNLKDEDWLKFGKDLILKITILK